MPNSGKGLEADMLVKMGELSARVDAAERELVAVKETVEAMRESMATRNQLAEVSATLSDINAWMNKGSGAMWLLATIIPGGMWLYANWGGIKAFLKAALDIH